MLFIKYLYVTTSLLRNMDLIIEFSLQGKENGLLQH
jgi:hypothetical protein